MRYTLSICMAVYNQIELVKWNLQKLLLCLDDDVQIVVSDDCSTEDIKSVVDSFSDSRIKYCKTDTNIGHDANIINALLNCDSPYAFLLRSRDTVISDRINVIKQIIEKNPKAAYFRFGAIGENDEIRMRFDDATYPCGKSSIKADSFIPIHPSGELYNLNFVNRSEMESISQLVSQRFPEKNGFLSHVLLRHLLSSKGDLVTSSEYVWYYAQTYLAKDTAVNSGKGKIKGISPYSPRFQYLRYKCEIEYIVSKLPEKMQKTFIWCVIRRNSEFITLIFKAFNESEGIRKHYNCEKEDFLTIREMKRFLDFSRKEFDFCGKRLQRYISTVAWFHIRVFLPLVIVKRKIKHEEYRV